MVNHPEMADELNEVLRAMTDADLIEPDPRPGRQRYYRQLTTTHWMRAVTAFAGESVGFVTAFVQWNRPRGMRVR